MKSKGIIITSSTRTTTSKALELEKDRVCLKTRSQRNGVSVWLMLGALESTQFLIMVHWQI